MHDLVSSIDVGTRRRQAAISCDRIRLIILSTFGMALFWPLFRYQSFAMVLYPSVAYVPLFGVTMIPAHAVFLAGLTLGAIIALANWRRIGKMLYSHSGLVCLAAALATLGAMVAVLCGHAVISSAWLWVSALLVGMGFIAIYLGWALYFTVDFSAVDIAVLGSSLFLSYVLFSRRALFGSIMNGELLCCIAPLASSLFWIMSFNNKTSGYKKRSYTDATCAASITADNSVGHVSNNRVEPVRYGKYVDPLILVVCAFLVIGAAVRGVVDTHNEMAGIRFDLSIIVTALLTLACLLYWKVQMHSCSSPAAASPTDVQASASLRAPQPLNAPISISLFATLVWIALSLLFVVGLFILLVFGWEDLGGDIVVVSRTVMEFALWVLLCDLVNMRHTPVVQSFVMYGIMTEVLSWLLSYVAVPLLLNNGAQQISSSGIVVTTILGVLAIAVVILGIYLAIRRTDTPTVNAVTNIQGTARDSFNSSTGNSTDIGTESLHAIDKGKGTVIDSDLARRLMQSFGFTKREADVAMLYASGFSLHKVADEMGITVSTAQSHAKMVYRKLGIHSKDELVEVLNNIDAKDNTGE